jgi:hypothetical protein
MTDVQKTTANQIIKDYRSSFYVKPIPTTTGANGIYYRRNNGRVLHPHYQEMNNGNIIFGIGTEYTEHGMMVIGINSWEIIKPNGAILDRTSYSNEEIELTKNSVEISAFSSSGDLIRF